MTKEELAAWLNGGAYLNEITKPREQQAKEHGLVVVFGGSDDLMEIRGAVHNEVSCFGGGTAYFSSEGLLINSCSDDDCPYYKLVMKKAIPIEAVWGMVDGYSWTYETEIPHATFEIIEDGEPYCRGIVFALADVEEH